MTSIGQEHMALKTRVAELEAESKARLYLADMWKARAEQAERERDEARALVETRTTEAIVAQAEGDKKTRQEREAEKAARERAEVDNAAHDQREQTAREDIIAAIGYVRTGVEPMNAVNLLRHALDVLTPHANPGAALLERERINGQTISMLRERLDAAGARFTDRGLPGMLDDVLERLGALEKVRDEVVAANGQDAINPEWSESVMSLIRAADALRGKG